MTKAGSWRALFARPPALWIGFVAALGATALSTGLIYALREVAPVVSLGVVYLPGILLISTIWGLRLGLLTSILSALAFNFFHIPPLHRLTIAEEQNWVALAAFVIVAVATSTLAELARARAAEAERRRQEADLATSLARLLLAGTSAHAALQAAGPKIAEALGIPWATVELGEVAPSPRHQARPLRSAGRQVATLTYPRDIAPETETRLRESVAPAIGALTAIALERDRVQRETVETEALRRSDDLKTALLQSVSHDLRTPLTAILAAGGALASPSLRPEERSDLSDAVVHEGRRLARMVDNLLDLSRLEAGRAEPRREQVDLAEVLEVARDALRADRARFRFAIDRDLPMLRADAAQLERAFANLLENAARHGDGRPVLVRSRLVGPRLVVRIVDQGPGIPAPELERIFEPFYRGADGDADHTGSGLGLAIAKGFIEANGGEISVESLPGQGTSFVVSFPSPVPKGER